MQMTRVVSCMHLFTSYPQIINPDLGLQGIHTLIFAFNVLRDGANRGKLWIIVQ